MDKSNLSLKYFLDNSYQWKNVKKRVGFKPNPLFDYELKVLSDGKGFCINYSLVLYS